MPFGVVWQERYITRVEKISFTWHYGKVWFANPERQDHPDAKQRDRGEV